eukprot:CAMPEP_0173255128 /NCGR_PEP_ID=MMETSP1142-20121109/22343_1 /TAXON_ID=483371 /ORGANISM="non described non described, Strain CCMP2298" /LENGTH=56 /DNA_ID=CAMNT_0014188713 /DNA_START=1 /DNA_END=167 /DNA_ORIENTATION=+
MNPGAEAGAGTEAEAGTGSTATLIRFYSRVNIVHESEGAEEPHEAQHHEEGIADHR